MKGPFGSAPVVFVILAVVLATAGLIWAHWYTSLRVDANIHTGNVGIEWSGAWTNDDGVNNDGWDPGDDGGGTLFDFWGESSSDDPKDFGDDRYMKDVARCLAGGGGEYLDVSIENAYPSYHCVVQAPLHNFGSVPIKALPGMWTMQAGYHECDWYEFEDLSGPTLPRGGDEVSEFLDFNTNGVFDDMDIRVSYDDMGPYADLEFNGIFDGMDTRIYEDCYFVGEDLAVEELDEGYYGWGHYEGDEFVPEITGFVPQPFQCGTQLDPGFSDGVEFGFHVEQPAIQNGTYRFTMDQEFVNWNEFDDGWCEGDGPTVTPGEPDRNKGLGVRYKSFGETGSREVYLGVGDLGLSLGGDRVEVDYAWSVPMTRYFQFEYDPGSDLIRTTLSGGFELEYPNVAAELASLGNGCTVDELDFMVLSVVGRDDGVIVQANDVVLNGYPLGSFDGSGGWYNWTVENFDFTNGFVLGGNLVASGTFDGGDELSKIEFNAGCLP